MLKRASSRTHPSFAIERELLGQGYVRIAGVDEAGRGALAGPLSVGVVVYNPTVIDALPEALLYVNDSKQLSPHRRCDALEIVRQHAEFVATTMVLHRIIDRYNINGATEYALRKLLHCMSPPPDVLIMDGNFSFSVGIPCIPVVGGDGLSLTIASASIAAKVRRDEILERFDARYPAYNFKKNKGYGTAEHRNAIVRQGPCPIHRRSFAPVKGMERQCRLFNDED